MFNWLIFGVMYVFGFDLFFDFVGYIMFVLVIFNLMGIKFLINFDKFFKLCDLKEFWNRWYMSFFFWFRDFVFMRFVKFLVKNKVFKNCNVILSVVYIINMFFMGFWYGLIWYYIVYGFFYGIGLVINDVWVCKKKNINKERRLVKKLFLLENKWIYVLGVFIIFNVVMFFFLIFLGFLDFLWFL